MLVQENSFDLLQPLMPQKDTAQNKAHGDALAAQMVQVAKRIWRETRPGSLIAGYLASRGLNLPVPATLRYHPSLYHNPTQQHFSGMVASISVWPSREVTAVHRTYLTEAGRKIEHKVNKATLGRRKHGAIRLAPQAQQMAIAEGIETSLTIQQCFGVSCWSTVCAGGMRDIILPALPFASTVIICADNDASEVGLLAAEETAERLEREGRKVDIRLPPDVGTDFNDVLMREPQ